MNVSIKSCARCGQDHDNLEFSLFAHPVEDSDGTIWAYWAACPTNGEPILMRSQIKAETTGDSIMECTCPPNQCLGTASIYECRLKRKERLLANPVLYAQIVNEIYMTRQHDALSVPELRDLIEERVFELARNLRHLVIQQQYNAGNLTKDEALELLRGPLSPDDPSTVVDDSSRLRLSDATL